MEAIDRRVDFKLDEFEYLGYTFSVDGHVDVLATVSIGTDFEGREYEMLSDLSIGEPYVDDLYVMYEDGTSQRVMCDKDSVEAAKHYMINECTKRL